MSQHSGRWFSWHTLGPGVAALLLVLSWGSSPGPFLAGAVAAALGAAVLAAVHHAEVVAHRVGEPYGSLLLAVAVTVIEVGLIVTLMVAGGQRPPPWPGTPCSLRS